MNRRFLMLLLLLISIIGASLMTPVFATVSADYTLAYDDSLELANVTVNPGDAIVSYEEGKLTATGVGTTTITVGGVEKTVEVSPAKVNVVLIAGQSNAAGIHGKMDGATVICPDKGYGYIWENGGFADLNDHVAKLVADYPERSVGLYPALAKKWYDLTGEKVIIIHTASSGKAITNWASYEGVLTSVTTGIVSKVESCITAVKANSNFELVDVGYYWVQGESDAWYDWNNDNGNYTYASAKQYEAAFTPVHNAFIAALETSGLDAYGGNVCLRSIKCLKSNGQYNEYSGVRVAQQNMANQLEDFYMATVKTEYWLGENYTSGIIENLHYTQYAYNEIGTDAAINMVEARDQNTVTGIQLIGKDGVTFYSENDVIYVEDNMGFIGPYNAAEEDSAQLAARVLPIHATSNGLTMTLTDLDGNSVTGVIGNNGVIADASKINRPMYLTVSSGDVTNTYLLTNKDYQAYHWTFDEEGNATSVTSDGSTENILHTDKGWDNGELTQAGAVANTLAMTTPVTLSADQPWTIEWKGGTANTSQGGVLLANNDKTADANGKVSEYIYVVKWSGEGYTVNLIPNGAVGKRVAALKNLTQEQATSVDTVFYMSHDGEGKLTIMVDDGTSIVKMEKAGAITQDFTFNSLKGYYQPSGAKGEYRNNLRYVKIYPGVASAKISGELDLGVDDPVSGAKPQTAVSGEGYTGTVVWGQTTPDYFAEETVYTATITLTAEDSVMFSDASVRGAESVVISEDGKTMTASITYPATEKITGYYWDFDGSDYEYVTGNGYGVNELTPNALMPDALDMARPITLGSNHAWTIEWKGGFSTVNTGNLHVVPLAYNMETDIKNPKTGSFIYICGGFDNKADTNKICVIEANKGGVHGSSMFGGAIVDNATVVDENTIWNISYDGQGSMTITVTLGETVQTFTEEVSFEELTFNGVKGFLWTSYAAYADDTMDYMKITFEEPARMAGDITGDEKVNVLDVNKLFGHVNGRISLDAAALAVADLNGDGKVNVLDVSRLFKIVNQQV